MKTLIINWTESLSKYCLLALSIAYIIIYLVIAYYRIQYPFELEIMEGAGVDHVLRLLSGLKYYVAPSIDYVPSFYTPLYFYVSALFSKITGAGFLPLRLVSLISSIGCFIIVYLLAARETKSKFTGILAAGFFAATFKLSGAWFDLARVDTLCVFLLLLGLIVLRYSSSPRGFVLAGVVFFLSFLTKQSALIAAIPLIYYCFYVERRFALIFTSVLFLAIGLSSVLFNYYFNGWYYYYVFELPRSTPINTGELINFWIHYIKHPLSIAFLISLFCLGSFLLSSNKRVLVFYLMAFAGLVGGAWFSSIHVGSVENIMIPAHAIISVLFAIGLYRFCEYLSSLTAEKAKLIKIFIYSICILQLTSASVRYNPFDHVPAKSDVDAGNHLIDTMAGIDGEVFLPSHGYLSAMAGKKSYAHPMGMRDVLKSNSSPEIKNKLMSELNKAVSDKKFSAIIIDSGEPLYPLDISMSYKKSELIYDDDNSIYFNSGLSSRPEYIYVPK